MIWESALLRSETLMHRLTHVVACGAVLLHIVGGCCWHHARAACPGDCDDAPQAVACQSCHDYDHGDHQACPAEHPQQHHNGCDKAPCVFVVPETGGSFKLAPAEPLGSLPPEVDTTGAAAHVAAHPADAPPSRLRADLRLHLVNQVFLL